MTTLVAEANKYDPDVEDGKHVICVLDHTGDSRIIWDPDNDDEVEAARQQFNTLVKKRFQAWSVNRKGDRDKNLTEFDPEAEKIIFTPPFVGG